MDIDVRFAKNGVFRNFSSKEEHGHRFSPVDTNLLKLNSSPEAWVLILLPPQTGNGTSSKPLYLGFLIYQVSRC